MVSDYNGKELIIQNPGNLILGEKILLLTLVAISKHYQIGIKTFFRYTTLFQTENVPFPKIIELSCI